MRLVVMGTGPFAVPMLKSLIAGPHQVAAVITRPTPAPKGREKTPLNPMRDAAGEGGLQIFSPDSVNTDEARKLLASLQPDLLVVCDFGQILSPETLAAAPLGGINLHGSLLPKYRGAAPVQWTLLNGDAETGVSVIHMTPRLDGGPVLATRKTSVGPDETMPQLEARLANLGIPAVSEALTMLERWDRTSPLGIPQDAALASKAPRLKKEHGAIHWNRPAEQIRNQVRALKPWPGTYTFWSRPGHDPLRLVVDRVAIASEQTLADPRSTPGQILKSDGRELIVATGHGALSLLWIQPAGKRLMEISDFLHGHPIRPGDVLTST